MNLNPGAVGVSVTTRPVLLAVARTLRGRDSRAFASAPARLLLSRGHLVPSARRLLATGPSMFLSRFTKNSATDMDAPPKDMDAAPSVLGLADRADHSWTRQLNPDPDTDANAPNRKSRQVKSGHYVRVDPTPLRKPECVIYSPDMLNRLGIDEADVKAPNGERFARFFSGDKTAVPNMDSWATPYALSIMGQRQVSNCPFGTGNGYGDGRAVSVGEVLGPDGARWEMQLKGGGPTPFCRGADGRAVLRSSVREFLASEAMHALGVETTRALSLVVSRGGDAARRPWYDSAADKSASSAGVSMDDPRLAKYPDDVKRQIIRQFANQKRDPDLMIVESCAITTRVAPSFTRIGHIDLFGRRASKGTKQMDELRAIVRHAIFREFPEILGDSSAGDDSSDKLTSEQVAAFLTASGGAIADMVTGWLRVGFCQGNFNADNCLVGGRTMDYGPFGWMDAYDPLFAKWTGSGEHFAFMNQPGAGLANFAVLAGSCAPLLDGGEDEAQAILERLQGEMETKVADVWRKKLGLSESQRAAASTLFENKLEPLMRESNVDYVLVFRQLAECLVLPGDASEDDLLEPLAPAFYDAPNAFYQKDTRSKWCDFIKAWVDLVGEDRDAAIVQMNSQNPAYVLREWMLVKAYTAAKEEDDFSVVKELFELTKTPYDLGSEEMQEKYYRRAPDQALKAGGTAFMS